MSQVPAGWYPDPERPGQQRWWDGTQWAASQPSHPPTPQASAPQPAPVAYGAPVATGSPANGMAIAALILSIIWLAGLGSILAIILGIVALRQIRESDGAQGGRGMAISGIVIGVIGVLGAALTLAFVLAVGDDLGDFVDCVEREAQQDDGIIDCEFGSLAG